MQVSEKPTFDQYYADARFARKHLQSDAGLEGLVGDNIYQRGASGEWRQQPGARHGPDQMARDLSCTSVLVSANGHFYYFGANAIELPPQLSELAGVSRGHRCKFDPGLVASFTNWLQSECKPGVHGRSSTPHKFGAHVKSFPISFGTRLPH